MELTYFDVEKSHVRKNRQGEEYLFYGYFLQSVAVMGFLLGKEAVSMEPEAAVTVS